MNNSQKIRVAETINNAAKMKKIEIDDDLFGQFKRSLEDLKAGRVRRDA